jgi:hypothetical protein
MVCLVQLERWTTLNVGAIGMPVSDPRAATARPQRRRTRRFCCNIVCESDVRRIPHCAPGRRRAPHLPGRQTRRPRDHRALSASGRQLPTSDAGQSFFFLQGLLHARGGGSGAPGGGAGCGEPGRCEPSEQRFRPPLARILEAASHTSAAGPQAGRWNRHHRKVCGVSMIGSPITPVGRGRLSAIALGGRLLRARQVEVRHGTAEPHGGAGSRFISVW